MVAFSAGSGDNACRRVFEDSQCAECGWRCDCISCVSDDRTTHTCNCSCQFWIISSLMVAAGFCLLLYSSLAYRRLLLSFFAAAGSLVSVGLCVAAFTIPSNVCSIPATICLVSATVVPFSYNFVARMRERRQRRLGLEDEEQTRPVCPQCGGLTAFGTGLCLRCQTDHGWSASGDGGAQSRHGRPDWKSGDDVRVIELPGGEVGLGLKIDAELPDQSQDQSSEQNAQNAPQGVP